MIKRHRFGVMYVYEFERGEKSNVNSVALLLWNYNILYILETVHTLNLTKCYNFGHCYFVIKMPNGNNHWKYFPESYS
jgi:hypothetical protein